MESSYTLALFDRVCRDMPPLVPEDVRRSALEALKRLQQVSHSPKETEDVAILHGKRLWPYRRAFYDFLSSCEDTLGTDFFTTRMPLPLQDRCQEFAACGGTLDHVRRGPPADFFSPEERKLLCQAFLHADRDLRQYARQSALAAHRKRYTALIERYEKTLASIDNELEALSALADREEAEGYKDLAREIRAHIRAVEEGLAAFGPSPSLSFLARAREYFHGRKIEKKMSYGGR